MDHSLLSYLMLSLIGASGCQTMPDSFVDMSADFETANRSIHLTDSNAIRYSNEIAFYLRKKSNGARITREMSNSAALALSSLAAPGSEILGFSMRTGSVLGLAGTGVRDFQGIFNAQGRSEATRDGVRFIEEAVVEYLSFNQNPSTTALTQNGVTLVQRTMASIHLVEKTLTGEIPAPEEMAKATEPMSETGAIQTNPGSTPVNNIPADPRAAQARSSYSQFREPKPTIIVQEKVIPPIPAPDSEKLLIEFTKDLRAFRRDPTITDERRESVYRATLDEAGYPDTVTSELLNIFLEADTDNRRVLLQQLKSNIPE